MVKNTSGGTKTKGLARKHIRQGGVSAKLRIPENELEKVVYVSKMLGNGMCEVTLQNGDELIENVVCFILDSMFYTSYIKDN